MLLGSLKIALLSLRTHKTRTILAMLGVFLGSLSLTGVLHVSKAMVAKAELETAKLGPNLLVAASGSVRFRRGSTRTSGGTTTFTLHDAKAIKNSIPQLEHIVPYITATMQARYQRTKVPAQIVATLPLYTQVRAFAPAHGRFLSNEDQQSLAKVCVLGQTVAKKLFGTPQNALGKTIFFYRANNKVVGVMEEKGKDLSGTDQDEQVFVPLSTYMRRMANQNWITGVYMNLQPSADEIATKQAITLLLRQRHQTVVGKDDFHVISSKDAAQLQSQALELVWTLGMLSSSISFMVGSLGILSIMILLVRARRLEIGVRRAVGALRRHIIMQFLLEAAIMSGTGGTFGVLGGVGLVTIVYSVGDFPFIYDPILVISACFASVILGVLAGAYPAWQASQVDPQQVLTNS